MSLHIWFDILFLSLILIASESFASTENTWNAGIYNVDPFAQSRVTNPAGIEVHVLKLIASKLKLQIEWKSLQTGSVIRAVGERYELSGFSYERRFKFIFSGASM